VLDRRAPHISSAATAGYASADRSGVEDAPWHSK